MSVTIHDLAKLANCNSSTVSRALRNDPRVAVVTRDRIHALANQYGYIPNFNARNLIGGKTMMIALLVGSLQNTIEREAAVRLNEIFADRGYILTIFPCDSKNKKILLERLKILQQKICDAAIVFLPNDNDLSLSAKEILKQLRCPLVFIDRWLEDIPTPVVTTDNRAAMKKLCDLAVEEGMDAALLNFYSCNTVSRDRDKCIREELTARGIPFYDIKEITEEPEFMEKNNIKCPAVFTNNANTSALSPYQPYLPNGFITAAFDKYLPSDRSKCGKIFHCIQDFSKISEYVAEQILAQLKAKKRDESFTVTRIVPCEYIVTPPLE